MSYLENRYTKSNFSIPRGIVIYLQKESWIYCLDFSNAIYDVLFWKFWGLQVNLIIIVLIWIISSFMNGYGVCGLLLQDNYAKND